jgi:predicted regulator of Ras-like GTPase activity (Roadblock/LC7/MglB family)
LAIESHLRDVPGAIGAVLTDKDGEVVDGWAADNSLELPLLAALCAAPWLLTGSHLQGAEEVTLRGEARQLLLLAIDSDCFLAALFSRDTPLGLARRAARRASDRLAQLV